MGQGHEDNYRNNRAEMRAEREVTMLLDNKDWVTNHAALQDGTRLQALGAKHSYDAVLECHPRIPLPTKYREVIEEAKNKVEEATGLCPMMERLPRGFRALRALTHLKDHMRCIVSTKLKCGTYWSNIPGYEDRAYCSFCKKKGLPDVIENGQHMWMDCENNGQTQAWETTRRI